MKRTKIAATILTVAMTLTAVPFQAVLADETEETVEQEEVVEQEEEIIISDEEIVVEEEVVEEESSVEEIETEESEIIFEAADDVSGVAINEDNFPDEIFRAYVSENFDDGDSILTQTEINAVSSISVSSMGISDMSGVEFFTNINVLNCSGNNLTSLTVNSLHLQYLVCEDNDLTSINIDNAPNLLTLDCRNNNLTVLDISNHSSLSAMDCSNNQITNLILNSRIVYLICSDNPLQTIDARFNVYLCYTVRVQGVLDGEGHITYTRKFPIPGSSSEYDCKLACDEDDEILAAENGWNKINGKWYFFTDIYGFLYGWCSYVSYQGNGPYFFDETTGAMQTGWLNRNNNWYYFKSSGLMVKGWQKIGNNWYYFNETGVLGSDFGAMVTGWQKISGKWYYFNSSGAMVTGWQKISGKWYYFNSSGAMLTGWQKISNKWYYFESSGLMKTGWLKSGGQWYYLDSSGAMLASTTKTINGKSYTFDANGVCINP